uniref:Uncharacterized protein LOC104210243 n=1 Tax=Nicotiana sylvestris TaxID=4096 RepID=A0A1U7UXA8_NICSY|nr:PREDICTED: uncharacterized protein LOC104210243 [Nicotiana sylvestris]
MLEDMLCSCAMDFGGSWDQCLSLVEFSYNNNYQLSIQMAPYETLYGRQCHSPVGLFEPGEAKLLGTDLVQGALEKAKLIQDRLHTTQSRHKSYVDQKVRDIAFIVGERALLQFSPMKGVMRFGKKGNLSRRYIRPFEILERIGEVAYKLPLPLSLSAVHSVFHISMLGMHYGDPSILLDYRKVQLDEDLTYIEDPMAILDCLVQKLRSKRIVSVKVQWRGHPVEKATWDTKQDMQTRHSHIFTTSALYRDFRLGCMPDIDFGSPLAIAKVKVGAQISQLRLSLRICEVSRIWITFAIANICSFCEVPSFVIPKPFLANAMMT